MKEEHIKKQVLAKVKKSGVSALSSKSSGKKVEVKHHPHKTYKKEHIGLTTYLNPGKERKMTLRERHAGEDKYGNMSS